MAARLCYLKSEPKESLVPTSRSGGSCMGVVPGSRSRVLSTKLRLPRGSRHLRNANCGEADIPGSPATPEGRAAGVRRPSPVTHLLWDPGRAARGAAVDDGHWSTALVWGVCSKGRSASTHASWSHAQAPFQGLRPGAAHSESPCVRFTMRASAERAAESRHFQASESLEELLPVCGRERPLPVV